MTFVYSRHGFPPELVEPIILLALPPPTSPNSAERHALLRACCLVCHMWREIAQPLLVGFPTVTTVRQSKRLLRSLDMMINSSTAIFPHMKELRIDHAKFREYVTIPERRKALNGLKVLSLRDRGVWNDRERVFRGYPCSFKRMSKLPSLSTLHLEGLCDDWDFNFKVPGSPLVFRSLLRLSLHDTPGLIPFIDSSSFPSLRHLSLGSLRSDAPWDEALRQDDVMFNKGMTTIFPQLDTLVMPGNGRLAPRLRSEYATKILYEFGGDNYYYSDPKRTGHPAWFIDVQLMKNVRIHLRPEVEELNILCRNIGDLGDGSRDLIVDTFIYTNIEQEWHFEDGKSPVFTLRPKDRRGWTTLLRPFVPHSWDDRPVEIHAESEEWRQEATSGGKWACLGGFSPKFEEICEKRKKEKASVSS